MNIRMEDQFFSSQVESKLLTWKQVWIFSSKVRVQQRLSAMRRPLQLNRDLLALFNSQLSSPDTPSHIKWKRKAILVIYQICQVFGCISSSVFIMENFKTDLSSALYAVFQVAATFNTLYFIVITWFYSESLCNFFAKCDDIRANGRLRKKIHWKADLRNERQSSHWKWEKKISFHSFSLKLLTIIKRFRDVSNTLIENVTNSPSECILRSWAYISLYQPHRVWWT